MSVNEPGFPQQIWNALSPTRVGGGSKDRGPSYEDWDQVVAEMAKVQNQLVIELPAGEDLVEGDFVRVSSGQFLKALADITSTSKAIGVITKSVSSGATVTAQIAGVVTLSGLTPNAIYYLSDETPGAISTTAGAVSRIVGIAISTTELILSFSSSVGTQGPEGPQGPQGPQGDPGTDGQGFTFLGAWSDLTSYVPYDVVTNNGSTYVCILASTDNEPPNVTYWALMAAKGDTGATGATGPQGDPGNDGADGTSIVWQGSWSSIVAYVINDAVERNGTSYICTQAHTNQEPPNATYWDVIAAKGDTGATGSAGADAPEYSGTSTTSNSFGVGTKTFTTQAGLAWVAGSRIRAISDASLEFMEGVVSSYSGTTLEIAVEIETGSGTHTDWTFSLAGEPGTNGLGGNDGADGQDGLMPPGGRLTVTTGVPVTTSDVNDSANLYYTPYLHNHISIYNGSTWDVLTFSETAITIPATTNTNYDIFAYNNSGTLAFETVNWTNDTTRATALTVQDGRYVKSGDATRLYIGTGRTSGTSARQTDSAQFRQLFNMYNRVTRTLRRQESATSWNYSSSSWRQVNANTSNILGVVVGVAGPVVDLKHTMAASMNTGTGYTGIGFDTTGNSGLAGIVTSTSNQQLLSYDNRAPAVGYHTWTPVERVNTTTTHVITIDNTSSELWGIFGTVEDM